MLLYSELYFDESLKFYGPVHEISVLMANAQNLQKLVLYNDVSSGLAVSFWLKSTSILCI